MTLRPRRPEGAQHGTVRLRQHHAEGRAFKALCDHLLGPVSICFIMYLFYSLMFTVKAVEIISELWGPT